MTCLHYDACERGCQCPTALHLLITPTSLVSWLHATHLVHIIRTNAAYIPKYMAFLLRIFANLKSYKGTIKSYRVHKSLSPNFVWNNNQDVTFGVPSLIRSLPKAKRNCHIQSQGISFQQQDAFHEPTGTFEKGWLMLRYKNQFLRNRT